MSPQQKQRLIAWQLLWTQGCAWWMLGFVLAWAYPYVLQSYALGGLSYLLAQALCLKIYFSESHPKHAKTMLRNLWVGKVSQWLVMGVLSVLWLKCFDLNMPIYLLSWLGLHALNLGCGAYAR